SALGDCFVAPLLAMTWACRGAYSKAISRSPLPSSRAAGEAISHLVVLEIAPLRLQSLQPLRFLRFSQ
ncbi:MAG: hypothetical protein PVG71_06920, partial [Anaerolineae bacterium]